MRDFFDYSDGGPNEKPDRCDFCCNSNCNDCNPNAEPDYEPNDDFDKRDENREFGGIDIKNSKY